MTFLPLRPKQLDSRGASPAQKRLQARRRTATVSRNTGLELQDRRLDKRLTSAKLLQLKAALDRKADHGPATDAQEAMEAVEKPQNGKGLPDPLRTGLERLSGLNLSGVRVHRSSPKPARLNALAYTQ